MKKTGLKANVQIFSVDYNPVDAVIFFTSNHTKCVSLSNQKCEIHPALINLHPNDYSQQLHCYPFAVKLDRCVGSCNIINHLSTKVCVPNETEDLNVRVFNMINKTCILQTYM